MYHHTQIGWLTLVLCGLLLLLLLALAWTGPPEGRGVLGMSALLLFLVGGNFATLTVQADDQELRLWFGPGLIRRRIPFSKIRKAEPVTNRWWWGFGIRWYGPGWLWNVSGLGAVELSLQGGGSFRIGTDEPERLSAFLSGAREGRSGP